MNNKVSQKIILELFDRLHKKINPVLDNTTSFYELSDSLFSVLRNKLFFDLNAIIFSELSTALNFELKK